MFSFRYLASILGIDRSIFFTSLARIIQAVGGIVSILFIAKYLTEIEQGFYYTFGSIVAIQIFFELGLNGIITQYVAHEVSYLDWVTPTHLSGEDKYLSRLSSLLHFSVKWYLFFAIILFVTLLIVGFYFFNIYGGTNNISWRTPWFLLSVATAINLLLAPILAFLEGLGKVKDVAKIRLFQQCGSLLAVWGGLFFGAKLYIVGLNLFVGIILILLFLFTSYFKELLLNIWHTSLKERVNYRKEIFPYQWKIALSWISGYFIFQLFNPVLFATEGAIIAGQMGMTLAALNGILSLSLSWMTTKIPLFSGLIAQKQYSLLDTIFNKTLRQSIFINATALLLMIVIVGCIKQFHIVIGGIYLGNRLLDYLPMTLMMIPIFINQIVNSWALYLRCHKQEPFLINSIVNGGLCCLSTFFLGKYFGVLGLTSGYCFITLMMSIWGYHIYITKKRLWHIF